MVSTRENEMQSVNILSSDSVQGVDTHNGMMNNATSTKQHGLLYAKDCGRRRHGQQVDGKT